MNTPHLDCDSLKVNLQVDNILNGLSGSVENYGAFRATVDITQDRTLNGIDPKNCSNHIRKVGDKYGVQIEWNTPDCDVIDDTCTEFTCEPGALSVPTTQTTEFVIDECLMGKVTIPYKEWKDTCCGVEEYYRKVVDMRQKGATGSQIAQMIRSVTASPNMKDRSYEIGLISEKIQRTMDAPIVGAFAKMNDKLLTKINAAVGYNHVVDVATSAPVGVGTWEMPVLYSQNPGCPALLKRIDANSFRREMQRFVRTHPRCGAGFSVIGGDKFLELFDEVGIQDCCDQNGLNQRNIINRALGFLGNFYYDSTIDTKFLPGTFFIIENNSLALFWLTLFGDEKTRPSDLKGEGGKFRSTGLFNQTFSNCRGDFGSFPFDAVINTHAPKECMGEPTYSLEYMAKWGLFTMPAVGCDNPTTGIYRGVLTDICS